MMTRNKHWPILVYDEYLSTVNSLHLWSQIVGEIRLSKMPWINHSWHVPLYVAAQGLTSSLIPNGRGAFHIDFDFGAHQIGTSEGENRFFALKQMSVAYFYREIMRNLDELNIEARIWPIPVEIPGSVQPFDKNESQTAYDPEAAPARSLWQALVQVQRVFTCFRARFIGKVSPVHLFRVAFDLAVTRFSGRTAPKYPGGAPNCADWVMEEAYSHELSSVGFWFGAGLGEAAFYSYAYPEPDGFRKHSVRPQAAYYHKELGEYLLPYEEIRTTDDPDLMLLDFLQSTYEAAAEHAGWDRRALERNENEIYPPKKRCQTVWMGNNHAVNCGIVHSAL